MKLKINQVSRLSGFSASTIRFYEKAGVISPLRTASGKYRDFSLHELQLLLMCKNYRDCGFSLPESVELLNHADLNQLNQTLEKQCSQLTRDINRKQLLLEFLKKKHEMLICHQEKPVCCQLYTMPAMLRIKLWQPGDNEKDHVPFPELYEWFDLMPFCDSSLTIEPDLLKNTKGEIQTRWYVSIEEDFARRLGFTPRARVEYIPARECIRTVVPITENLTILSLHLAPIRECLTSHHLEVKGPAISRILYHTNLDGVLRRYDQLWVPV
jgi:DNA-binding transcriptional MerR regulator